MGLQVPLGSRRCGSCRREQESRRGTQQSSRSWYARWPQRGLLNHGALFHEPSDELRTLRRTWFSRRALAEQFLRPGTCIDLRQRVPDQRKKPLKEEAFVIGLMESPLSLSLSLCLPITSRLCYRSRIKISACIYTGKRLILRVHMRGVSDGI